MRTESLAVCSILLLSVSFGNEAYAGTRKQAISIQSKESISAPEFGACQIHIEQEISIPEYIDLNAPSITGARIIYSTNCMTEQNGGKTGELSEPELFASVDAAKNAAIPAGCTFAYIDAHDGHHVWSPTFGWEFHKRK